MAENGRKIPLETMFCPRCDGQTLSFKRISLVDNKIISADFICTNCFYLWTEELSNPGKLLRIEFISKEPNSISEKYALINGDVKVLKRLWKDCSNAAKLCDRHSGIKGEDDEMVNFLVSCQHLFNRIAKKTKDMKKKKTKRSAILLKKIERKKMRLRLDKKRKKNEKGGE